MNDEEQFTKFILIPTLYHVGFRRVRYIHGVDEYGRDVVFFDIDRFGKESLHAAQVKYGDLRGSQKAKIQNEIIPQLREGLRTPYRDPETGRSHRVSRMYLIISGEMLGTARSQIHSLLESEPNIVAVDRQTINLLSDREGVDTMFGLTNTPNTYGISTGGGYRPPRLPILTKGSWLEIPVSIEEFDFHADTFEIANVIYNPMDRIQTVCLHVPDLTDEILHPLLEAIYTSLRESVATLWQVEEAWLARRTHDDSTG